MTLIDARGSKHVLVLDFSHLWTLSVYISTNSDLVAVHALMKVTKKLETLLYDYTNMCMYPIYLLSTGIILITLVNFTDGCRNLAASMNLFFSTLRLLYLRLGVPSFYGQDPLSRIYDELAAIAGHNVIEELDIDIAVYRGCERVCTNPARWGGRLDGVLATGFPRLTRLSLHVLIETFLIDCHVDTFMNRLKKLQFPWLSKNPIVKFDFSVKLERDGTVKYYSSADDSQLKIFKDMSELLWLQICAGLKEASKRCRLVLKS